MVNGYKTKMSESKVNSIEYENDSMITLIFEDNHKLLLGLSSECCEISLFFNPNLEACIGKKIVSITEDKNFLDSIDNPKSRSYGANRFLELSIAETDDDKSHKKDEYYISNNTINFNLDNKYDRSYVDWHKYVIKLSNGEQIILWSCTISNGFYKGELTIDYI